MGSNADARMAKDHMTPSCERCGKSMMSSATFCIRCSASSRTTLPAGTPLPPPPALDLLPHGPRSPDQDWLAAQQLADALRSGWTPIPVSYPISLRPGEQVVQAESARLLAYTSYAPARSGSGFIAFGSPLLLVASVAGSIGYNAWRNQKNREEAAAQWRLAGSGIAYFTNQRLAIASDSGWVDFHYSLLQATELEGNGIVLYEADQPRVKVELHNPLSNFVLLRYLLHGEVPALTS